MKSIPIAIAIIVVSATFSVAQTVCTKPGDGSEVKIYIRNATEKSFSVKWVDDKCKETDGESVEPGRAFNANVQTGQAFRVREADSNQIIKEVIASSSNHTTTVGNINYSDPRTGFIETLNRVRRGRNLTPMELSDQLNQACQWFADLMAKYDKGGHDAVDIGGTQFTDMQHPWLRTSKFGYEGNAGTEATGEGDWSDLSLLGGDSMMGWASSNTHFRPFLSLEGQEFKNVGFAFAKSQKKPGYYYTCSVFGNPLAKDSEGPKSEKPDGLKFTSLKFLTGEDNYSTSFSKSNIDELKGEFAFDNPSEAPFTIQIRKYLNGKFFGSENFDDLKGSGAMSFTVTGQAGATGKVLPGTYKIEVRLNGEVLISSEATVR